MARMARTAKKSFVHQENVAEQLLEYRAEIDELRRTILALSEADTIGNVLQNGFATLLTQLEPLQELSPQRTLLSAPASGKLQGLRASLDRPEWIGAGGLSIPEMRVPFISEAPDPADAAQIGTTARTIPSAQRFQS